MKLIDLYNKELREQLSKEEWDNFLSKYSFFIDKQGKEMNEQKFNEIIGKLDELEPDSPASEELKKEIIDFLNKELIQKKDNGNGQ